MQYISGLMHAQEPRLRTGSSALQPERVMAHGKAGSPRAGSETAQGSGRTCMTLETCWLTVRQKFMLDAFLKRPPRTKPSLLWGGRATYAILCCS